MPFRLVTWNCREGVDRKRGQFDRLAADVLVVPECGQYPLFARELGVSFAWRGTGRKGLGVFGRNGWQVVPAVERNPLPWVLPLHVVDPAGDAVALLLAVGTVPTEGVRTYAGQIAMAISEWEQEIRDGATILAGDFNCSAQTADARQHHVNVDRLHAFGAVSAYHGHAGLGPSTCKFSRSVSTARTKCN